MHLPRPASVLAAAAALAAAACQDPNSMFEGRWVSVDPPADRAADPGALWSGAPTLALGHYGQEVTGVVYFAEATGGSTLADACACAWVDHGTLDLGDATLRVTTDLTTSPAGCGEDALVLDWRLALVSDGADEEPRLVGEVQRADSTGDPVAVRLKREQVYLPPADLECPRATPPASR